MLTRNELKYIATKMAEGSAGNSPPQTMELNTTPGMMDKLKEVGKDYGAATGIGAGAGAVAGIPVALLAHALMADKKNQNLRSYLKSALLGSLIGGGAGAAGGAGLRAYLGSSPESNQAVRDFLTSLRGSETDTSLFNRGRNTSLATLSDAFTHNPK